MKLLVLTAFYPIPGETHERMFVHVRNRYYLGRGIDVTVLNFAAKRDYEIDGVRVVTPETYEKTLAGEAFDICVSHSANVRNHYRFLKKHEARFGRLVFFFHGHEVLYLNRDYPAPYPYMAAAKGWRRLMQDGYDRLKIGLWRGYYKKLAAKSDFVFVSDWLLRRFMRNARLTEADLNGRCRVIHNSIGAAFETARWDAAAPKDYDYISIRSNLDGSKYCVDCVARLAQLHPERKFLVIGRGRYFDHNPRPDNLDWIDRTLDHAEMFDYLNRSRCAIMLTREDTQGVMTCELAAYGMPVITSDIDVCHEFFEGLPNVALAPNDPDAIALDDVAAALTARVPCPRCDRWDAENTIAREVDLFREIRAR